VLARTPNYTCLETVSRFHREAGVRSRFGGELSPLDVLQLEIVYANHHEWYGLPGAANLSENKPDAFIASGMFGNGAFAIKLNNILAAARFVYGGKEALEGRTAVRYDYRIPRSAGELEISIPGGLGTVGEEGSIWADAESLDLLRISSRAAEIPPYLPLAEASADIVYAPMRIGGGAVILAQRADLHLLEDAGTENFDRIEFTHCRAYSATSEIRFDTAPEKAAAASPAPASAGRDAQFVPALLLVTIQLSTPISDKDWVGTPIEGRVQGDVRHKEQIVIPNGSVVRGRVRRLERYERGGAFIVGLEFTQVDLANGPVLFYADLLRMDKNPRIKPSLSERVIVPDPGRVHTREEVVTLSELPGVASFFVSGKAFTVPKGFGTVWRTRGPIR